MLCCCTLVIAQHSWLRLAEEEVPLLLLKLRLVKVSADALSLSSRTPVEWTLLGQRVPAHGKEWFAVE